MFFKPCVIGLLTISVLEAKELSEFTLEEKVGQVLCVHFHGEEANDDAKYLVQTLHVGGIIYFQWANSLHSKQQVKNLSSSLRKIEEETPLLICIDQEGGKVRRLTEGFIPFPSQREVSKSSKEKQTALSYEIGMELKSVGIDCTLGPVVDIDSNPNNPVIGERSFGNTPNVVLECGAAYLEGYQKARILNCLKHFPGHGDVGVDSHYGLPILEKSLEELRGVELFPFADLCQKADAVLTAHIVAQALDQKWCATLSNKWIDYLRETLGFEGLIITDSLVMQGVLDQTVSEEEAAILALNAGADLLLFGGRPVEGEKQGVGVDEFQRIHRALMDAIHEGRVSIDRLNQAVERVLAFKEKYR